ncbi:alpha/beta-Hydrolases superfamily protein [Striga asiatica]|uniref:Alpha/beta-Hydrolases superfamily protein n=1 Tax=Striga asiatica TaxID=4170 RepID=A0A5A7QBS6_STRAF|nr:alpha/beta-Hydrolases superfamily protein [Striga asiatica]
MAHQEKPAVAGAAAGPPLAETAAAGKGAAVGESRVKKGSSEVGRMSHGGSGRTGNSERVSVSLHERQTSLMRVRSPMHRLPNIRPITSSGSPSKEEEREGGLWAPREKPGMKDVKRREYHLRKGNNIVNFVYMEIQI